MMGKKKKKNSKLDLQSFICSYFEKDNVLRSNVVNRLEDLHGEYTNLRKLCDSLQEGGNDEDREYDSWDIAFGIVPSVLEESLDDKKYNILKTALGFAAVMAKQDDELIDLYCEKIAVKTPYYHMLVFEKTLRDYQKGNKELHKDLVGKLKNYRNIDKEMDDISKFATGITYQAMAIVHGYNTSVKGDTQFEKMAESLFAKYVDIQKYSVPRTLEEAFVGYGKYRFAISIMDKCETKNEVQENRQVTPAKKEDVTPMAGKVEVKIQDKNMSNNNVTVVMPTQQKSDNQEKSITKESNEEDVYLDYAKHVFNTTTDFGDVEFKKFNYSVTKKAMGKVYSHVEIMPFEDAKTTQHVKYIYAKLTPELQEVFLREIMNDKVRQNLMQDIKSFDKLDLDTQKLVSAVCKDDEELNSVLTIKQRKISKQKNKDIRQLVRFANRDDSYYGLDKLGRI